MPRRLLELPALEGNVAIPDALQTCGSYAASLERATLAGTPV